MKRILLTIITLCLFVVVGFAQAKPDVKNTPEATAKAPAVKLAKPLTAEQSATLQQAQQVRALAETRAALAKAELEKVEAQILAMVREFAIQAKIDPDEYEIDLAQISQGVVGFKPKEKPPEKPTPPKKE